MMNLRCYSKRTSIPEIMNSLPRSHHPTTAKWALRSARSTGSLTRNANCRLHGILSRRGKPMGARLLLRSLVRGRHWLGKHNNSLECRMCWNKREVCIIFCRGEGRWGQTWRAVIANLLTRNSTPKEPSSPDATPPPKQSSPVPS